MSGQAWIHIVQWTIWGILMTIVMGWVARSRLKTRPPSDLQRLVHPPSTLIIGLGGFLFFATIAVISNVFANKTTTWWTTAIFVGFALLSVPMIADYFRASHIVSEEGLNYGRLNGARGNLKWSELRRVTYASTMKWFRLEGQSGNVARISAMLIGLPEFARLLLAHTPPGAIDADTLPNSRGDGCWQSSTRLGLETARSQEPFRGVAGRVILRCRVINPGMAVFRVFQ